MKAHEAPTSSRRDENSLYSLTKRFVKLLWESPDHAISITTAASMLNVVKRRVYDITNVLESIDLITKWNVNSVKWIGGNAECIFDTSRCDRIIQEIEKENAENIMDGSEQRQADCVPLNPIEQIEKEIEELNRDLQDISACRDNLENAFVSYTDIKSVKQLNDKLLFAIKAPDETSIEYPKYEKGSYRMKISTDKGEISVFYIDNKRHSTKKE